MFDLPLHMGRDQIEESLRTKMASIKVQLRSNMDLWAKVMQSNFLDKWPSEYFLIYYFSKNEGSHGSAARCTKGCRSHFWGVGERTWAWSSACWGKKHYSRAGIIMSLALKLGVFLWEGLYSWKNCGLCHATTLSIAWAAQFILGKSNLVNFHFSWDLQSTISSLFTHSFA